MSEFNTQERIAVILAGGKGRRMGGRDKGEVILHGRRLVDWVVERLAPQADRILISGAYDYGTGLTVVADRKNGPAGPAAGLWAALCWLENNLEGAKGFVTAPVDGPFLPADLVSALSQEQGCAVACDESGRHPTFAFWETAPLKKTLQAHPPGKGLALHALADECNAQDVIFTPPMALMNINSPEDLAAAQTLVERGPSYGKPSNRETNGGET